MSLTAPLFAAIVLFFGLAFLRTLAKTLRGSRLAQSSWDDLISLLQPLPIDNISQIAIDYLHPCKGQVDLDRNDLWTMIGRSDGLQKMYSNAAILMALANHAQRWNFDESVVVAERMRRDAMNLRRAIFALSLGLTIGYGKVRVPFSVQEAASAYYLMRARLLALYETSHVARFPELVAAL